MLVLINADSKRAGCRLRWWNLNQIAKSTHLSVKLNHFPSEKRLLEEYFPKFWSILPKSIKRLIQRIALINHIWFLITLISACVVVTGKPNNPRLIDCLRVARRFGTRIIIDACDIKPSYTNINEAFAIATYITIPTRGLIAKVPPKERHKIRIIPDSLDRESLPREGRIDRIAFKERTYNDILWFGVIEASGPSERPSFSLFCDQIIVSIQQLETHQCRVTLVCSRSKEALQYLTQKLSPSSLPCSSREWSLQSMREELDRPGIVVIPYPEPIENCPKSANRIELSLYAGKKVVVNGLLPSLDAELQRHVITSKSVINPGEISTKLVNTAAIRHYLDKKQDRINQLWCQVLH